MVCCTLVFTYIRDANSCACTRQRSMLTVQLDKSLSQVSVDVTNFKINSEISILQSFMSHYVRENTMLW